MRPLLKDAPRAQQTKSIIVDSHDSLCCPDLAIVKDPASRNTAAVVAQTASMEAMSTKHNLDATCKDTASRAKMDSAHMKGVEDGGLAMGAKCGTLALWP